MSFIKYQYNCSMLHIRLSPIGVKGTSRILRPEFVQLSPAIGLLSASAPHIVANQRAIPLTLPFTELSKEFFFQRSSIIDTNLYPIRKRYGHVNITKSRSRAAYWISSAALGRMVGLAYQSDGYIPDKVVDQNLSEVGIVCNYAGKQWSGVSMARYRKIANLIAQDVYTNRLAGNNLTSPVSLAFLWEKATTKKCLLDFILEFEAASGQSVLLPQYDALRIEGSDMQRDWLQMKFHNNEITSDILKIATHVVFGNTGTGNMSVGEAIEIISASYAMESSFKPPIKLGRYAYLDGKPRPDCVEIVVREIIDTLIYDSKDNRLCLERLPPSTLPSVQAFYASLATGELDDLSTLPAAAQKTQKKAVVQTSVPAGSNSGSSDDCNMSNSSSSRNSSSNSNSSSNGRTASTAQYWEATTAGQAWFSLCSELAGSEYLSRTPQEGRVYELKPTMRNVSRTVATCLGFDRIHPLIQHHQEQCNETKNDIAISNTGISISKTTHEVDNIWTLKRIEHCWNAHISRTYNSTQGHIATSENILLFRAPFSDTETVTREIGNIVLVGQRNAIEIELENAHNLATVKHKIGAVSGEKVLWGADIIDTYKQAFQRYVVSVLTSSAGSRSGISSSNSSSSISSSNINNNSRTSSSINSNNVTTTPHCTATTTNSTRPPSTELLLFASLLGEYMIPALLEQLANTSVQRICADDAVDCLIEDILLGTKWGEERNQGIDFIQHASNNINTAILSATDANLTNTEKLHKEKESIKLTLQAIELIKFIRNPDKSAQFVRWMLQEASINITAFELSIVLLKIPSFIRGHKAFQLMISEVFNEDHAISHVGLIKNVVSIDTPHATPVNILLLTTAEKGLGWREKLLWLYLYARYKCNRL